MTTHQPTSEREGGPQASPPLPFHLFLPTLRALTGYPITIKALASQLDVSPFWASRMLAGRASSSPRTTLTHYRTLLGLVRHYHNHASPAARAQAVPLLAQLESAPCTPPSSTHPSSTHPSPGSTGP